MVELTPDRIFASKRHRGQMYGQKSYVDGHLAPVVALLRRYGFDHPAVVAAGWCHDVVEDTETTIDEVRGMFGETTARLVWAVTSEPGKNRKERNAATYPKIRAAGRDAVAIKLCDRIVNVEECWVTRDAKLFMYHREYRDFSLALRREEDGPVVLSMWDRLDKLLGWYDPSSERP
jgi:(p)ppGpp synthase/HD superfamily hydrolase